jgi:Rad3-related DNA helicase/serine/threonine protein kinase
MAEVELQQIGPYAIIRLVRISSASDFYIGMQPRKKEVLIKRLKIPLTTVEAKDAFLIRAKQFKTLKDRSIVEVKDVGFDGDYGYLVMEYVIGETLSQRFAAGKILVPDEVKRVLSPVAAALQYAHMRGILHGNLHPGNIIAGERNAMLLTEFALRIPAGSASLDDDAFAIPYMAPEQLGGTLSAASDQYALAVMAYEWLCGRRPYEATERDLLLQQQEQAPLPSPRNLNPAISPAIEHVMLRALAYKVEERFSHIQDFADNYLGVLMGFSVKSSSPHRFSTAAPAHVVHPTEMQPQAANPPSSQGEPLKTEIATAVQSKVQHAPATPLTQTDADEETTPREKIDSTALTRIVEADLCQGGVLSQSLPGYEERPAQIEMTKLVAHSLMENIPAIIEAGTGTGKGLAYLVPIVRSGKVAIVSTANKALQEQLFYKDIPFVQQHIKHFEAALVKGVSNYVCIDRLENERVGMQFYSKNREFSHLVDIVNDAESTFMGDFETLGFQLPADVRTRVATDSDQCAWSKCNYFADCYVRLMRERASRAQVIVVNHTLLLLDAALDGFLLPERDVIILDEAHHLEEEATRAFTITISPTQITLLLAQRLLKDHSQLKLQDEATRLANSVWQHLALVADPGFKGRVNLEAPLEEGLRLATVIADLADSLRKQRPKDMPEKEGQLYDKLLKRTQNLAEHTRTVFSVGSPDKFVYYIERAEGQGARGFQLQASAAPLDITAWLKERLFEQCNVICTSATLATFGPNTAHPEEKGPNFSYFRRRIGLDAIERPEVLERILPLAFDYESNALLYLPRDLPAPAFGANSEDYMKAIAREMYRLVKASRGRAFLLFSSKRMLDRAYELMSPHLAYPLLKQGDTTRIELTRRFREEEGAVLFGLKSFWEGVDIAGDALSLVVIDKLPFDPPDDPVHEARVALMKAAGENWFGTYVLPQAVLRLKQGLGRLLRTREDRGVMAILDTRLHTKGYGKQVLNALPPARRTMSISDVERFFL